MRIVIYRSIKSFYYNIRYNPRRRCNIDKPIYYNVIDRSIIVILRVTKSDFRDVAQLDFKKEDKVEYRA